MHTGKRFTFSLRPCLIVVYLNGSYGSVSSMFSFEQCKGLEYVTSGSTNTNNRVMCTSSYIVEKILNHMLA